MQEVSQEIINKYLSIDQNFIKKIEKPYPLTDKQTLYNILKWWRIISKADTIGDLKKASGHTAQIHIKLGSNLYCINADTNKEGVGTFLKNKTNNWSLIANENGRVNKVTNDPNKDPIKGLYIYKI